MTLATPTLDAEGDNLLRRLSAHGGYAFVNLTAFAVSGDFKAAEAARDMAWEQLHSGPWDSVLPDWRDAYSMACLLMAKHRYSVGDLDEALKILDFGLIMGGVLLRKDLESSIIYLSAKITTSPRVSDECREGSTKATFRLIQRELSDEEVIRVLPPLSLTCMIIDKRMNLSMEAFLCNFLSPGSPVIISDCMSHWPARTKWNNIDYLQRVAGYRTVPVEVGKNYLCEDWKQELITFSEFLLRIQSNDFNPSRTSTTTYLAQHPLFDQIQELRNDICIPDYCFAGGGEMRSLNAWFGPTGTVTPLHHDPHHNILAQVVGRKYIRLYPPSMSEELYPYTETMLSNSSQVDLDNLDERVYPKVQGLEFRDCILEEGEMLYIPPKWWHYVRSLTPSLSVSFWWN